MLLNEIPKEKRNLNFLSTLIFKNYYNGSYQRYQAKNNKCSKRSFFKNGYTNVSVEEIVNEVDISKKTLYRYFPCKDDILTAVVIDYTENLTRNINEMLVSTDMEFVEKLKIIFTSTAISLSRISAKFYENIRKSSPEAWSKINTYKREVAQMCFSTLMDEGIKKGHISKEINKDIALLTFLIAVDNLLDPAFLDQLPKDLLKRIPRSPREIFDALIKVIYEGILTEDSKKKYKEGKSH